MNKSLALLVAIVVLGGPVAGTARADEMSGMTMASGPMAHMAMTTLRSANVADRERAAAIVVAAKSVMAQYTDVASATRDGYKKFLPTIELPMEHFTNDAYAVEAFSGHLNPAHPTSLIYERKRGQLHLVGVMYTAARTASDDQLNTMVPLSVAQWHKHVNYCFPPAGTKGDARFGLVGSIGTKDACDAVGGRWMPQLFGWMVHVWPLESDPKAQWAVDHPGDSHHSM
jgi:hypothetical protein